MGRFTDKFCEDIFRADTHNQTPDNREKAHTKNTKK